MTKMPSIQEIVNALRSGQPQQAEHLCRELLAAQPDEENALLMLAMSLQFQRKLDAALATYKRLTELHPGNSVHWCNYATALFDANQTEASETAYTKAIGLDPANPDPRIHLGLLQIKRQDYAAARDTLLDAFDRNPNNAIVRIHAARACTLCEDFRGAEDLVKPWRQWLPLNDDTAQLELARVLVLLAEAPDAQILLEELLRRNPAFVDAKIQLIKVYERINAIDQAETLLATLENVRVNESAQHGILQARALLATRRSDYASARELLERAGPLYGNDYAHFFELAKICDKLKDPEAAMQAARQAHLIQVEEFRISSPASFTPEALPLPAAIVQVSAQQYQDWPQLIAPDSGNSPVFIIGFPRSGTTLLEQMLDAHPKLQSMDENPFFDRLAHKLRSHDARIMRNLDVLRQYDCDELRKHYLLLVSEKIQRRWDAQLVDKNPFNMLWLPMIYRLFPAAKFIVCLRHPCDVMLSCYMQNFRSSVLGAACENLQRLAGAYVQAMQCWLHHVEVFQPNVLISRYEDLVADPVSQTRRIGDFLGLEDAAPLMTFDQRARDKGYIATPSYTQVIQPVNKKGLNRWHRYREYFEPALPILEPMLKHWGYTTD